MTTPADWLTAGGRRGAVQIAPRPGGVFRLKAELVLPHARGEVFAVCADAHNLEALTPPWLRFQIVTPDPISMQAGTRIAYRLRLHGLPLGWESAITVWQPPVCFVDEQRRGPYRHWRHEHTFWELGGATAVRDQVDYAPRGGRLINRLFVALDLTAIFRYRQRRLAALFGSHSGCPA
jgi:ligand-binding SRPBCC domain-containing protein